MIQPIMKCFWEIIRLPFVIFLSPFLPIASLVKAHFRERIQIASFDHNSLFIKIQKECLRPGTWTWAGAFWLSVAPSLCFWQSSLHSVLPCNITRIRYKRDENKLSKNSRIQHVHTHANEEKNKRKRQTIQKPIENSPTFHDIRCNSLCCCYHVRLEPKDLVECSSMKNQDEFPCMEWSKFNFNLISSAGSTNLDLRRHHRCILPRRCDNHMSGQQNSDHRFPLYLRKTSKTPIAFCIL